MGSIFVQGLMIHLLVRAMLRHKTTSNVRGGSFIILSLGMAKGDATDGYLET